MQILNRLNRLFQKNTIRHVSDLPIVQAKVIEEIIFKNRKTLKAIPRWLEEDIKQSAYFKYGVPDEIYPLLDLEINDEITYTDIIVYCSRYLQNISYLELGVSVGKNFFQLANQFENAKLLGFDIENINPVMEDKFELTNYKYWEGKTDSLRKENSYLKSYRFLSNQVDYLAADIWDENSWSKLFGRKFNIIFSDALHDPKALLWEYEMINKYDLLDDKFIIFWDDLHHGLEYSFFKIARDLKGRHNLKTHNIRKIKINGWLGNNYPYKHDVGIVSNIF